MLGDHFFRIRITHGSLAEMAESLAILDQKYHIGILTNLSTKPRKIFIKIQQNLTIFHENSTKPSQFFMRVGKSLTNHFEQSQKWDPSQSLIPEKLGFDSNRQIRNQFWLSSYSFAKIRNRE